MFQLNYLLDILMKQDNELFLQYVADNYKYLEKKNKAWAYNTHREFNEDIFSQTILNIYELLTKNGKAKDNSDYGFECLFFRAFSTNTDRESQYARNKYKDGNVTSEQLFDFYEDWKNGNEITPEEKVEKDLYNDFAINYILNKVEQNFDIQSYRLYRIKLFYNCTYVQLKELTKVKDCKAKCTKIQKWLKENIKRKEVEKAFEEYKETL